MTESYLSEELGSYVSEDGRGYILSDYLSRRSSETYLSEILGGYLDAQRCVSESSFLDALDHYLLEYG